MTTDQQEHHLLAAHTQRWREALAGLDALELAVTFHRLGLPDAHPRPLSATSALLDLPVEVVARIEAEALSKLRHPVVWRKFRVKPH